MGFSLNKMAIKLYWRTFAFFGRFLVFGGKSWFFLVIVVTVVNVVTVVIVVTVKKMLFSDDSWFLVVNLVLSGNSGKLFSGNF